MGSSAGVCLRWPARPVQTTMPIQSNLQRSASSTTRSDAGADSAVRLDLRRLERVFESREWPDRRAFLRARKRARAHAMDVFGRAGWAADGDRTPLLVAAAE